MTLEVRLVKPYLSSPLTTVSVPLSILSQFSVFSLSQSVWLRLSASPPLCLSASLCVDNLTAQMYAGRKKLNLESVRVELSHNKVGAAVNNRKKRDGDAGSSSYTAVDGSIPAGGCHARSTPTNVWNAERLKSACFSRENTALTREQLLF